MENKKILIIDDEPAFLEACSMTFRAKAFQVTKAASSVESKELVKHDPDIIILGTLSPAGEAFNLHKWLKAHPRYKDIPILVVDSCVDERQIHGWRRFEGMQLEAEGYVSKPIEPIELVPRILLLLEESKFPRKIKVLIVDDHTMVRDGIRALISMQKDIEVVGEAVNGLEAMEQAKKLLPSVTLMDIVMPVMSGLEATRYLSAECPETKVLILTQYDDEENLLLAKQAGAHGFIPKRAASSELLDGIRAVSSGKYFSSAISK